MISIKGEKKTKYAEKVIERINLMRLNFKLKRRTKLQMKFTYRKD